MCEFAQQPWVRWGRPPERGGRWIAAMNADELQQLQAPIKTRYKEHPEAAKHTFRATGTLVPERPSIRIETAFARYDAGLHKKAGGSGTEACSGDLLLESLVACAGDEQLATLLKLTERYCVIFQTLRTPPRLSATIQRSSG